MIKSLYLILIFNVGFSTILNSQQETLCQFEHPQMGTLWKLSIYADDSIKAQSIAKEAFLLLDNLNTIFSDYDQHSKLNQLCAQAGSGQWVNIDTALWEVPQYAKLLHQQSRGAFDISVGPLTKIWRRAFRRQVFPSTEKLMLAQQLVKNQWIKVKHDRPLAQLKKKGMQLDLGGIAKGYTLDRIGALLEAKGLYHYLIDGGGDLLLGLAPPKRKGWAIAFPDGSGKILERCAVATAGAKYHYIEYKGQKYSHLIDPRTGFGITEEKTISVIAPNGMIADAWASALSILSIEEIQKVPIRFLDGIYYIIY